MVHTLIILISIFSFALFDYIFYDLFKKWGLLDSKFINPYRTVQAIVQVIITLLLLYFYSYKEAISFNLLWWTWFADWLYYAIGEILGIYGRGWMDKEVFGNQVEWAWWTPYGLVKWLVTGQKVSVISWQVLAIQTLIGISITIILNLNF